MRGAHWNPLADAYFVIFYDQRSAGLSPRVDASDLSFELTGIGIDVV